MKALHRPHMFGWSKFDEARNIDFHGLLWARPEGGVLVDPLPLSPHDAAHLRELGGASLIVITNSDHVRAAKDVAHTTGARIIGPQAERERFPIACDDWVGEGDEPVPGLSVFELEGSKTPGELALLIEGTTLVTGDLVRAHAGGSLCLLPDPKLSDRAAALRSLERLVALGTIDAVLVGDGWPIFRGGQRALEELIANEHRRQPPM